MPPASVDDAARRIVPLMGLEVGDVSSTSGRLMSGAEPTVTAAVFVVVPIPESPRQANVYETVVPEFRSDTIAEPVRPFFGNGIPGTDPVTVQNEVFFEDHWIVVVPLYEIAEGVAVIESSGSGILTSPTANTSVVRAGTVIVTTVLPD
jgi:hypothetical protein